MTTILIKKKDTAGAPAPGDLTNAAGGTEIAVNTATKRIYTKDSGGNVVELGTNSTSSTIDQLTVVTSTTLSYGTANQVQYLNASKLLVGSANLTFNGTTLVANDITDSSLTSGRVTYAGTAGNLVDSANLTFNGTTLTANTIGAFTLGGTIAGGGNQINNVIIGTTTPLAGAFTTLSATTAIRVGAATSDELLTINGSSSGFVARITNTVATNPNGLYINSTNAIGTGTAFRVDSQGISLLTLNVSGLAVTNAISATASIKAATSVAAQGTFAGYTGAGIFMSYESTYGRIESYDYSVPGYKDIGISPNGGNVGVGMVGSSTYGKFTVNGNIAQYGSTASGNELGRFVWFNTANNYETGSIRMVIGAGQINRGEIGFYVNNGGGQIKAMYIDYGQNVDISAGGAILSLNRGQYSQQTKFYQDTGGTGAIYETTNPTVNAQYYAHIFKGTNNVPTTVEYGKFNQWGLGLLGASPSSGAGITFPATQSASSNANTLDDYEEGTWTPTATGGSGGSGTVTLANGWYVKIGRFVTLNIGLALSSKGTLSGQLTISNLPFAPITTGSYSHFSGGVAMYDTGNSGADTQFILENTGTAAGYFVFSNASATTVNWSNVGSNPSFFGSVTYQVA